MKKLSLLVIILVSAGILNAQNYQSSDGKIYAAGYGSHDSTTLSTLLTKIGSINAHLVINGGSWAITDSLTFGTNITVEIPVNSSLNISTTKTFTINGPFEAGAYSIRSGDGIVNGAADFLYRWPEWGPTNKVNFSTTGISASIPGLDAVLTEGNDADGNSITGLDSITGTNGIFDNLTAGSFTTTGANTNDDLTVNGDFLITSNDMAVSYMGYPKIALTTNMLTVTVASGTQITMDSFTNVFDNSLTTVSSVGDKTDNDTHSYMIDLGANYIGEFRMKYLFNGTAGTMTLFLLPTYELPSSPSTTGGQIVLLSGDPSMTNIYSASVSGRYINFMLNGEGTPDTATYQIYDMSFYGVTNGYRNLGGF